MTREAALLARLSNAKLNHNLEIAWTETLAGIEDVACTGAGQRTVLLHPGLADGTHAPGNAVHDKLTFFRASGREEQRDCEQGK